MGFALRLLLSALPVRGRRAAAQVAAEKSTNRRKDGGRAEPAPARTALNSKSARRPACAAVLGDGASDHKTTSSGLDMERNMTYGATEPTTADMRNQPVFGRTAPTTAGKSSLDAPAGILRRVSPEPGSRARLAAQGRSGPHTIPGRLADRTIRPGHG